MTKSFDGKNRKIDIKTYVLNSNSNLEELKSEKREITIPAEVVVGLEEVDITFVEDANKSEIRNPDQLFVFINFYNTVDMSKRFLLIYSHYDYSKPII